MTKCVLLSVATWHRTCRIAFEVRLGLYEPLFRVNVHKGELDRHLTVQHSRKKENPQNEGLTGLHAPLDLVLGHSLQPAELLETVCPELVTHKVPVENLPQPVGLKRSHVP